MATTLVDDGAGLAAALKSAQAGDVIKLAGGTYSDLALSNLTFSSDVTVTSLDASKPAVITNFTMSSVTGVTFSNLVMFAVNPSDVGSSSWAFRITKSNDIHFDNVAFHGSLDGNAGNDINGLQIRFSNDVSVTNSTFQQLGRGLNISEGEKIKVADNEVLEMRTDGFDFAQVGHVEITGNHLHDFSPVPGDHPDAIQFWTKGTASASHDILISGNVIMRGEGSNTQGIFLTDQTGTLPYERVTITNNLVVGTGSSAVRVVGGKDVTVTGNELITFEGGTKTNMLMQKVDGLVSSGNKAISIGFDQVTGLSAEKNAITSAVKDLGVSAVRKWIEARPETTFSVDGLLSPGDRSPVSELPTVLPTAELPVLTLPEYVGSPGWGPQGDAQIYALTRFDYTFFV